MEQNTKDEQHNNLRYWLLSEEASVLLRWLLYSKDSWHLKYYN